ncbi:MAG: hypothetical protein U0802_20185 [Candidatus Binatia bacterium]
MRAQNLGDQPVAVSAQISNGLNTIGVASGALEIAAGRAQVVASTTAAVFGAYCVFTSTPDRRRARLRPALRPRRQQHPPALPRRGHPRRPLANVTTTSPPVRSSEGDVLSCVVQNLSDAPVTVSAAINNGLNTIVDSGSLEVPAGRALALASTTAAVFSAYCTFTFSGSPRQVRGYVQLFDLGGSNTRLLYPARVGSDALLTWQGGVSQPARTWSAPVRSSQGDVLSCVAQNLTNQTVAVTATIHNGLGATVASGMLDVAPGRAQTVTSTTAGVFGAFCEFAFDASILDVRGFIELFDPGGSNTRLLYPAEIVAPTDGPGIPPHRIVSPPAAARATSSIASPRTSDRRSTSRRRCTTGSTRCWRAPRSTSPPSAPSPWCSPPARSSAPTAPSSTPATPPWCAATPSCSTSAAATPACSTPPRRCHHRPRPPRPVRRRRPPGSTPRCQRRSTRRRRPDPPRSNRPPRRPPRWARRRPPARPRRRRRRSRASATVTATASSRSAS